MNYLPFASLFIFVVTLIFMIKPPKGMNLGIIAGLGAGASLMAKTVSPAQALNALENILDAAFAFIGIVTFSVTLDKMGFFKWAALKVAEKAGGNGVKLYFYIAFLSAGVSILFANDSAVLILTPIVIEIIRQLDIDEKGRMPYLFSAGLIADTAAMPFITSNPVNIVSADFFKYTFIDHLIFMVPVAIVTITLSILIVYIFWRGKIPRTYSVDIIHTILTTRHIISQLELKVCLVTLALIDIGYVITSFLRIPVSIVICSGAMFLLLFYMYISKQNYIVKEERASLFGILKELNWGILLFMVGIFTVVQGLKHAGVINFYSELFIKSIKLPGFFSILVPSLIVTISASAMNNWPMTLLGLLAIQNATTMETLSSYQYTGLIFSNIIGNNLGPHFFPLGSLAILMWMDVIRRKGLTFTMWDYLKVGSILSILEVLVASLVLWVTLLFVTL